MGSGLRKGKGPHSRTLFQTTCWRVQGGVSCSLNAVASLESMSQAASGCAYSGCWSDLGLEGEFPPDLTAQLLLGSKPGPAVSPYIVMFLQAGAAHLPCVLSLCMLSVVLTPPQSVKWLLKHTAKEPKLRVCNSRQICIPGRMFAGKQARNPAA